MRSMGTLVEEDGRFRLYECFIDGTFSKARGGGDGSGGTKAGKGVKIMILVDARGLPLAVSTAVANPHETRLIQEFFGFMLTTGTPERIIGDKACDSDKLDVQMAERGLEMIAPNRASLTLRCQFNDCRIALYSGCGVQQFSTYRVDHKAQVEA